MHPNHSIRWLRALAFTAGALLSLGFAGCASIVHSGERSVTINTNPEGATVTVIRESSQQPVQWGTTPMTISLYPRRGYFRGERYQVQLSKPGYETDTSEIRPSLSGWYFGNIFLGGAVGLLVVDPATGAMWNLKPREIDRTLTPATVSYASPAQEVPTGMPTGPAPVATPAYYSPQNSTPPPAVRPAYGPSSYSPPSSSGSSAYQATAANYEKVQRLLQQAQAALQRDPSNPDLQKSVTDLQSIVSGLQVALEVMPRS